MSNFKRRDEDSIAWRFLGEGDGVDYYVVNEASENDSLTGVYGEERSECWTYPLYMNGTLRFVQEAVEGSKERTCYELYKADGGRFTHSGRESECRDMEEYEAKELARISEKIEVHKSIFDDMVALLNRMNSEEREYDFEEEISSVCLNLTIYGYMNN